MLDPLGDQHLTLPADTPAIFVLRRWRRHHGADAGLASLVGQQRSDQSLPVDLIGFRTSTPARGGDGGRINDMTFNAICFERPVYPEAIQPGFLDHHDRKQLAGPACAFFCNNLNRPKSAAKSPPRTECFDIFARPPGGKDVISQVDRLNSKETKIAPRSVRIAVDASGRSAVIGMVGSRGRVGNLTLPEIRPLSTHEIWSHEIVVLNGATVTVKVAHMRLCHSRMPFVRAYPRETQEMVFDAHDHAFAFFKGACGRGIYDNMKTAVETVFAGKNRLFNRRFMQMCSHYLIEPVACTPAAGWEKGQVENQAGLARERFFTPRLRFKSYDEMNVWLLDQCVLYAKAHRHPEIADKTIWDVFEEERQKLVPYRSRFDGFHEVQASVSKTCLVRFDNNKYSVNASAIGCPVDIQAYADRVIIRQNGRVVAGHPRAFGRRATIYDPWHYVPVLARKPGALRNGAPFKDWVLPANLERVRRKLAGSDDGDRANGEDSCRRPQRRLACRRSRLR